MSQYLSTDDGLKTLDESGVAPECRMKDASSTQSFCRRLIQNDSKRSYKRSRVNGLVDGNPPYQASKLRAAGRADAANFNTGNARSYMESGCGSFYDLSSEAPSCITFRTEHGTPEQQNIWSDIAAGLAHEVVISDRVWDYQMQVSQWEMVLHGCGPFFFEDPFQIFPRAVLCGDLKVPEFTKSDTYYWESGMFQVPYYPAELYKYIRDEESARKMGWNVEYTKQVIINAMGFQQQRGIQYDWTFYQQELKNNSFNYINNDARVSYLCHVFWQEFDGRITHAIVQRDLGASTMPVKKEGVSSDVQYLCLSVGKYANWDEAIHPMYFDHGNGGFHHSVTGLGVKMYSMMEYENRLVNNLCDKAFSPKILFKPTTTEAGQKFELQRLGDFAVMNKGWDWQQTGVAGLMNDGIAMRGELQEIMQNTLSSYKQGAPSQKSGNPVTKFEKQMEAAMQSAISKTQFNRYYKQLDMLYGEIWKRLTNPNTTDQRAKDFQKKCRQQGVPPEALLKVGYVGATRVVGQGSAFMRKQAIDSLFSIAGSLPEDGRNNLINDKIAAEAGQQAVNRYNPPQKTPMPSAQQDEAMLHVASMKVGLPPLVTSSQNPLTYAATYLKAGSDAMASLPQGANPMDVYNFMTLCGPAIASQLRRFGQDPTRVEVHKIMADQWKQLALAVDNLKKMIEAQQKKQQEQQQNTQQAMTDEQLQSAKTQAAIKDKDIKTQAQLKQSQEKHNLKMQQQVQSMHLQDAATAAQIQLDKQKADAQIKLDAALAATTNEGD